MGRSEVVKGKLRLVGRRHSLAVAAAGLRASARTVPTMDKIVSGYRINTKQIFPEQRPLRY